MGDWAANEAGHIALLRAYAALLIDNALPHSAALDVLTSFAGVKNNDASNVAIPIHPSDATERHVDLSLADVPALALRCWRQRERHLGKAHQASRERIEIEILEAFPSSLIHGDTELDLAVRDVQALAPIIAIHNGAEPFMISALAAKVRPTSQSMFDPYYIGDITKEPMAFLVETMSDSSLRAQNLKPATIELLSSHKIQADWIARGRKLLRDMCNELNSAHSKRIKTPLQQERAELILRRYRMQAITFCPEDSVVVLAIDYSKQHYIRRGTITARSLRDYLDRAVMNGLMDSESSDSLSSWDPDDFEENIEERISSPNLSMESRRLILNAYAPIVRFIAHKLKLPAVSIAHLRETFVTGSGQWGLISPHVIDRVILDLYESDSREYRQVAIVIALAFYGGLRASEIRRLRLDNIVFSDVIECLDIEILNGKSAASRRRLPFLCLAPPEIVHVIVDYGRCRRSEFSSRAVLSKIAAFGPLRDRQGYSHNSLTRFSRNMLKSILGDRATLHLLRHCFCSFLFLRWYATRYPDVLDDIRFRSHPLFQPSLLEKLDDYFACTRYEDGDIRPFDLISMTKLTGHASPETLFQYYVHTYSIVQAHAAKRIRSVVDDLVLTSECVSCLLPRARSSSTIAKTFRALDNKTLGALARQKIANYSVNKIVGLDARD